MGFYSLGLLQVKERAEIRVVVAQVRCKAIDTDIFRSVGAFDRDELPLFGMHHERIFEGARAEVFYKSHVILFVGFDGLQSDTRA